MWYCINNVLGRSSSPNSSNSTSSDCINGFSQTVAITSQYQSTNSFCSIPSGNDNGFSFNEITVPAVLSHINKLDVKRSTLQALMAYLPPSLKRLLTKLLFLLLNYLTNHRKMV